MGYGYLITQATVVVLTILTQVEVSYYVVFISCCDYIMHKGGSFHVGISCHIYRFASSSTNRDLLHSDCKLRLH